MIFLLKEANSKMQLSLQYSRGISWNPPRESEDQDNPVAGGRTARKGRDVQPLIATLSFY